MPESSRGWGGAPLLALASAFAAAAPAAEPNTQVPAGSRHHAASGFPDCIAARDCTRPLGPEGREDRCRNERSAAGGTSVPRLFR